MHPRAARQGRSPPLPPPPVPIQKPLLGPLPSVAGTLAPGGWGGGWGKEEEQRPRVLMPRAGGAALEERGSQDLAPSPGLLFLSRAMGAVLPGHTRPEPQHGRSPLADGKLRLRGGVTYSQARGSAKIRIPGAAASWALKSPPRSPL